MFLVVYGQAPERVCSYQDVLNYLNLTKDNELFSMTRPVKDYKQPTEVSLEVLLYAILDVVSGLTFMFILSTIYPLLSKRSQLD